MKRLIQIGVFLIPFVSIFACDTQKDGFKAYKEGDMEKAFQIYTYVILDDQTSAHDRFAAYAGRACCMYRLGYGIEEFSREIRTMIEKINKYDDIYYNLFDYIHENSPYTEVMREIL